VAGVQLSLLVSGPVKVNAEFTLKPDGNVSETVATAVGVPPLTVSVMFQSNVPPAAIELLTLSALAMFTFGTGAATVKHSPRFPTAAVF
jgi:hypothetical protein